MQIGSGLDANVIATRLATGDEKNWIVRTRCRANGLAGSKARKTSEGERGCRRLNEIQHAF